MGNVIVPSTGGWNNYKDFTETININSSGESIMRIEYNTNNAYAFNIDKFELTKKIVIGTSAGFERQHIHLFPNPVTNILNIKNEPANTTFTIFNNHMKALISSKESNIDVSELATGSYVLQITSTEGSTFKQFLKL